jgi:hypothetical protein
MSETHKRVAEKFYSGISRMALDFRCMFAFCPHACKRRASADIAGFSDCNVSQEIFSDWEALGDRAASERSVMCSAANRMRVVGDKGHSST